MVIYTVNQFLVQACLRAPPVVADEAKLAIVLVQVCLRGPPVVADEAKLAIVFTYFFLLLVLAACVRHPWWQTEAKLAIVFTFFFFYFFLFFSSSSIPSAFHPLRGNSRD